MKKRSDLITVFAYLDSITLWQYNGTEAGAAVMKSVTMGSLLFALVSSVDNIFLLSAYPII